jgi:hypothetical protein
MHRFSPFAPRHSRLFLSGRPKHFVESQVGRVWDHLHRFPTIRHSPSFSARRSLLVVFRHSLFAARPGQWVSTNGGSPTHPRTVGARHAVPLRLAYPTGPWARAAWLFAAGDGPPARCRRHNTTRAGLGPAPTWTSTIPHSPFAIPRFFHSPFAIRYSLSFSAPPEGVPVLRVEGQRGGC